MTDAEYYQASMNAQRWLTMIQLHLRAGDLSDAGVARLVPLQRALSACVASMDETIAARATGPHVSGVPKVKTADVDATESPAIVKPSSKKRGRVIEPPDSGFA
jgi:hypothetical protein